MTAILSLRDGLEPLQAWFDANVGHTRLVAIQSAT